MQHLILSNNVINSVGMNNSHLIELGAAKQIKVGRNYD